MDYLRQIADQAFAKITAKEGPRILKSIEAQEAEMQDKILRFAMKWTELINVRGPKDLPEMQADLDDITEVLGGPYWQRMIGHAESYLQEPE